MDMNKIVEDHNIIFITFDTLRYDVATEALEEGATPNLKALFKGEQWEKRHSPASFTYAAHQAFFAGFLPTPVEPGNHERLFACNFAGSETTKENTCTFNESNIIKGLSRKGYHTVCIGGVGFFNKQNELGKVIPDFFDESHWSPELGVTDPQSTQKQFNLAETIINKVTNKLLLFINISALHQPNNFYLDPNAEDSKESHRAALEYIDSQIPILVSALEKKAPCLCIFTSDHGTTYGEDGYYGHRLSHEHVWSVPYKEFLIPESV